MSFRKRLVLRLVSLAAGIGLLVLGFVQGQFADVLQKAVKICLECIGIG